MRLFHKGIFLTLYVIHSHAMMARNNELGSQMSNFQVDNTIASPRTEPSRSKDEQESDSVLSMLQNVLCRHFPSIPCAMIIEDEKLKKLIERSIQQLKYKKLALEKTTPAPGYHHLTLFPSITSEDLSNFLQVSDSGYFSNRRSDKEKAKKQEKKAYNSNAEQQTILKESKKKGTGKNRSVTTRYNGRKKIRKFYPHKTKYKDKLKGRQEFGDYSEEKLSISVEVPDTINNMGGQRQMNFKSVPGDPPVWRIDYLKHGEPSFKTFGYNPEGHNEKLMENGPNGMVSENMLEQSARREVLHPDVYIKKNFVRQNTVDVSDPME